MKSPALGYVGDITRVNVGPINDLLEKGYIPVVSSLGCDDEGKVYNINADTMAAHISAPWARGECLISMTDIAGHHGRPDDPASPPFR